VGRDVGLGAGASPVPAERRSAGYLDKLEFVEFWLVGFANFRSDDQHWVTPEVAEILGTDGEMPADEFGKLLTMGSPTPGPPCPSMTGSRCWHGQ
jgi:hypothetical protein